MSSYEGFTVFFVGTFIGNRIVGIIKCVTIRILELKVPFSSRIINQISEWVGF